MLHCDNQGAGFLAKDPVFHARSKHIQIRYHFIRQIVELGKAMIKYVPTNQQIADGLTKSLKSEKQASFVAMLGLKELKE